MLTLRRLLLGVAAVPAVAACAPATSDELAVTWGEPGCRYAESSSTVEATLLVTGVGTAEVRVVASLDEDTTVPVGSKSVTVTGEGDEQVHEVGFTVSRPPFVDTDGIAACALEVEPTP